jgi:hypothetical protein
MFTTFLFGLITGVLLTGTLLAAAEVLLPQPDEALKQRTRQRLEAKRVQLLEQLEALDWELEAEVKA